MRDVSDLISCYKKNDFDMCSGNIDSEQAEFLLEACETEHAVMLSHLLHPSPARIGDRPHQRGALVGNIFYEFHMVDLYV